jgi:CRISPR-associated protein Cas2
MRWHYLVAYDIAEPERLRRTARVAEDFGDRIQFSVFVCQLSLRELAQLRERMRDVMHAKEDQVIFVKLAPIHDDEGGPDPKIEVLGRAMELTDTRNLIF